MKIAFIPLTNDINNPTDRLRCFEIIDGLNNLGHYAFVYNEINPQNYDALIIGNRNFKKWLPLVEKNKETGKTTLFDISDNIFFPRAADSYTLLKYLKKLPSYWAFRLFPQFTQRKQLINFVKTCDGVIVGSKLLQKAVNRYSKYCQVVPDPINTQVYQLVKVHTKKKEVSLVWTGFIDNLPYIEEVSSVLTSLSQKYTIRVVIVTSKKRRSAYKGTDDNEELVKNLPFPTKFIEWKLENINQSLLEGDIAIIPIPKTAAKSSNKVVTFMALKIPIVASNNPEYAAVISQGHTGFVAYNKKDWHTYLEQLITNHLLRERIGKEAYDFAIANFSIEAISRKWEKAILEDRKI